MRLPLTAALLVSFLLPCTAAAQQNESPLTALMRSGVTQADPGNEDNGWFFVRKDGTCRMYSVNDPIVLLADATDPKRSHLRVQMIDGTIAEPDGAQVPVQVVMRTGPTGRSAALSATATVAQAPVPAYLIHVPMKHFVDVVPDGFQLLLLDATGSKRLAQSDTRGTRKHLAALVACEG